MEASGEGNLYTPAAAPYNSELPHSLHAPTFNPHAPAFNPHAPAFNPQVPPPNMLGHPDAGFPQGHPGVPQQFPGVMLVSDGGMMLPSHFQHSSFEIQNPQDQLAFQPFPVQRGGHQHHLHNIHRGGWGNTNRQRGHRSRGGQAPSFFPKHRRGNPAPHHSNNSGQQNKSRPSHANDRHARNDYGDLLYSRADMSNPNAGNTDFASNPAQGSQDRQDSRGGNRNMYVHPVGQFKNRGNGSFQNANRGEHVNQSHSARWEREGFRNNDKFSSELRRPNYSAEYASRGRNGAQRPGVKKSKEDDASETEGGDRRVQMEEQLKRARYECMVCCDNIRQEVAVWSCQTCFHIFHLRCIKQWVKSSMEVEENIWRCPACQNTNEKRPNGYRCFCGKVRDPKFQPGETPHSCGEVCGRKGKDGCTHKCVLLCHPGPCPPCNAVVHRPCDCGVEKKTMRCGQMGIFRCDKVCGKDLNCGQHKCQVVCHAGPCDPCQTTIQQECYGGHKKREVLCGSEEAIMLSFTCQQACNKNLECGNHVCEELCHPGECGSCPLLPDQITHCCCGQTALEELDLPPRTSCLDPVPTCQLVCSRPMACGPPDKLHVCQQQCHEGPCDQCEGSTTLTCVCGANHKEFSCQELDQFTADEPFKCERRCNKKRLCGRHKCNELCCTRDVHICEIVCGRPLTCGLHKCEELCHRGSCRPCLQASFEELTCVCGVEVLYPPVPCGTKPPNCHRLCTRQHDCDHPVRHTCHSEETCPPCAELVHKMCLGDHEMRKNVPCYMKEITCGRPCGKPLPCGQHKCNKTCHKGPCLSEPQGEKCVQPCGKKRSDCPHPCGAPCHPDTDVCPQTACKAQMEIKCGCGHRTARVQCQAGSAMSAEIAQFQRLTVQAMASGGPGQDVDISQLTTHKKNTARQLECDSNCALLERNRRVALALEIHNPDLEAKLGGPKYTDFLKDSARKYPAFVAKVEKSFADLVQNAKQSKQSYRSFAFPSMNRDQRRVVHELAESYGCETQSYDYEPNKNVVATAYKSKCFAPSVTLTASLGRSNKAPPPIPHHTKPVAAWGKDKLVSSLFKDKDKDKGKEKADIDYFDFSSK